ncbi:MAG TPA: energy-coupling factor ABC transporter ATP-binding protein, partial [Isosphaeraceae bacterium]
APGHPAGFLAKEALQEVGLDPAWLERDAAGLSGGERQRLALAVAFQTDPAILALDEPTSALDPASARKVIEVLRTRSERDGLTTIAVTHSREHAAWLGDRAVVLDAGLVVDQGPTADVLERANGSFWAGDEAP